MNQSHNMFLAPFFVVSSFIIFTRQRNWKRDTKEKVRQVLHTTNDEQNQAGGFHDNHVLSVQQCLRKLPFAIQYYLEKVLFLINDDDKGENYMIHTSIATVKYLHLKQEGNILVGEKWSPFKATQYICASIASPGFVWNCVSNIHTTLPILKNLSIYARDSYVDGKGDLDVSVMGIVPIVSEGGSANMNSAELTRWLTEIVLYPTALLPLCGSRIVWVKDSHQMKGPWPEHHGAFARGRMMNTDYESETEVQLCFDDEGLVSSVRAYRAQVTQGGDVVIAPWEGLISKYVMKDCMLVPSKMEVGYWNSGKLQIYLRAVNTDFAYTYFE